MAENNGNGDTGSKGPSRSANFGFLTRKVGPLPIWAYALIAVGIYYWYTHYGPGASKNQKNANTDPNTGQSYPMELGAAQERIKILETQKTGVGRIDRDQDFHDMAKEKKVITPGAPIPTESYGPNPHPISPPTEHYGPQPEPGNPGATTDKTVIQTRWRGPYRAPKPHQVEYVPANGEPDHRPLGL